MPPSPTLPPAAALIVAAGVGARCGGGVPKQYAALAPDTTVLGAAVQALALHPAEAVVQVVIHADHGALYQRTLDQLPADVRRRVLPPVIGGAERHDSVQAGLRALTSATWVLIHDAARPYVPAALVDRLLAAAVTHGGAIPCLPMTDTVREVHADGTSRVLPRASLRRVQTPQAFHLPRLQSAYAALPAQATPTDDATVWEAAGHALTLVDGTPEAFKITTALDLQQARAVWGKGDWGLEFRV